MDLIDRSSEVVPSGPGVARAGELVANSDALATAEIEVEVFLVTAANLVWNPRQRNIADVDIRSKFEDVVTGLAVFGDTVVAVADVPDVGIVAVHSIEDIGAAVTDHAIVERRADHIVDAVGAFMYAAGIDQLVELRMSQPAAVGEFKVVEIVGREVIDRDAVGGACDVDAQRSCLGTGTPRKRTARIQREDEVGGGDAGTKTDHVHARAFEHAIVAGAELEDEHVVTGATVEIVVARSAVEHIIAAVAQQLIVAGTAIEGVVREVADQQVVAAGAGRELGEVVLRRQH